MRIIDEVGPARPHPPPVRAMLRLLFPASGWMTLALLATVLAIGLLPVVFSVVGGQLVGLMSEVAGLGADGVNVGRLLGAGVAVVAVFAGQQLATPLLRALAQALGRRVDLQLQARVMEATLVPAGIAHLDDPAMAECVWEARAVGTGEITARDALLALATLSSRALAGLGLAAVLVTYRWWMALLFVGLYAALGRSLMNDLRRYVEASGKLSVRRRQQSPPERELLVRIAARRELSSLLQRVRERVTSRAEVQSYPPSQPGRSRYRAKLDRAWLPVAATTAMALTSGIALVLLVRSTVAGQISLAQLGTYALAAYGLTGIVRVDAEDLSVRSGSAPVPVVAELEQAVSSYRFRLSGTRPADRLPRTGIRLDGVSFGYTWRRELVLQDVNLDIPAGRSLAIVGDKHAGKSTLVNLLARIYDPSGGRITVDGIDLADLDPGSWQDRVAVVFQDFTCYPLSLLENVTFGAIKSSRDNQARELAARQAGLDDVLNRLPEGWNSLLAPGGRSGMDLSEGEWQKVALARALFALNAGAGVLVLDEPTANLDVRSAAAFYDRFLELSRGVTTILVSHRLATVRAADQIVLLEKGRVVEQGDHQTLMNADGRYARLFELQSVGFTAKGTGPKRDSGAPQQVDMPAMRLPEQAGGTRAET